MQKYLAKTEQPHLSRTMFQYIPTILQQGSYLFPITIQNDETIDMLNNVEDAMMEEETMDDSLDASSYDDEIYELYSNSLEYLDLNLSHEENEQRREAYEIGFNVGEHSLFPIAL